MSMNWYYWDTDAGRAVACAPSVSAARKQILATLPLGDAAAVDLALALKPTPKVISGQPIAVMAWHR